MPRNEAMEEVLKGGLTYRELLYLLQQVEKNRKSREGRSIPS